jgi:hypothetical protein
LELEKKNALNYKIQSTLFKKILSGI